MRESITKDSNVCKSPQGWNARYIGANDKMGERAFHRRRVFPPLMPWGCAASAPTQARCTPGVRLRAAQSTERQGRGFRWRETSFSLPTPALHSAVRSVATRFIPVSIERNPMTRQRPILARSATTTPARLHKVCINVFSTCLLISPVLDAI